MRRTGFAKNGALSTSVLPLPSTHRHRIENTNEHENCVRTSHKQKKKCLYQVQRNECNSTYKRNAPRHWHNCIRCQLIFEFILLLNHHILFFLFFFFHLDVGDSNHNLFIFCTLQRVFYTLVHMHLQNDYLLKRCHFRLCLEFSSVPKRRQKKSHEYLPSKM